LLFAFSLNNFSSFIVVAKLRIYFQTTKSTPKQQSSREVNWQYKWKELAVQMERTGSTNGENWQYKRRELAVQTEGAGSIQYL